ncbi:TonB-dependent receptor [Terriglobus saanensis]|uniref:TonB-dependent receptor n=1 Tax=Terriglobus saanensis (strain ATCC BAA-1853 / DSM 23119 / SP1PR4) TaxID=401053 RepID=E8UZF5_TERSS|nr:TonB-dependent receptor [Terriglobus saanensis]ADV83235.1 TonB-dependent receptor [Terriglobus saanensis SP1PR4]
MQISFKAFVVVVGAALGLPVLVLGQQPSNGQAKPVVAPVKEQVTVTAFRTPLGLDASASSVRLLNGVSLEEAPGFTLDDRLRQVPGVELFRRTSGWVANPTTQGISLRGLGSTAASRTLVLSDEVPLSDPFGGWVHWNEIPVLAIESVEVVRGGASDLYGSSAIGGVINAVPVRSWQTRRAAQGMYGAMNTVAGDGIFSAARDRWGALAAGSIFRTDGYILTAPEARGLVDIASGVDSESGRVEVRRGDAERGYFLRGNVLNETRSNGTPITTNATRLWRYQGGWDQPVHVGRVFVRGYGSDQGYRQSFSTIATGRVSESLNRLQRVPSQELGASGQWASTIRDFTFVVGADARDVRATDVEAPITAGVAGAVTRFSARQRAAGGYGEALWSHGGWSAALSGRVDDFRTFDALKFVGTTKTVLAAPDEVVFDPRLGVVRRVGRGFALTGTVFRAFRGPTMNELYRTGQVGQQTTLANDALKSERATGFEFGAEQNTRWGTLRGSYFWTSVNRPITALLLSQTGTAQTLQRANLGQIQSRGVSLDFVAHPVGWMQLSGGYQYALATVTRFDPDKTLVGKWIPEVARNAGTVQMRLSQRKVGVLNVIARESGMLFDDSSNINVLHGFFRMDVNAERSLGSRFDVVVTVQNLLDRRIDAGRTPTLTLATPQVATIGLRWHGAR